MSDNDNDNYNNDENDNDDSSIEYDDNDDQDFDEYANDDEDLNDELKKDSSKNEKKNEKKGDNEEDEDEENLSASKDDLNVEEDIDINNEPEIIPSATKIFKIFPLISEYEYTGMIAELAFQLEESSIFVPSIYEELLDTKSGKHELIAINWVHNYKTVSVPIIIHRIIRGQKQVIDVNKGNYKFPFELINNVNYSDKYVDSY